MLIISSKETEGLFLIFKMDSFKIRLLSSIILLILCIGLSSEEFDDWFIDNSDENAVSFGDSSATISSIAQNLSSTSSEKLIISSTSTTSSPGTSSTSVPTTSSTSSTITSTPSTRTPPTSPSTTPSTRPTTPSTAPTTPTIPQTSVEPIFSSTYLMPTTDERPKSSSEKPMECLKIELNAKIIFKYKSNEGFEQEFELISGNTNGELIQQNKCLRNQTVIVKYDLVEKTQLILGISITDTDISIRSIRFEYPFHRLPDDFNKENHSEEVQTCSAEERTVRLYDKCLIAENKDLIHYSLNYKINDQIYCKHLPLILLKNNKTSIDILFNDFRLIITEGQTNGILTQRSDEFCPINTINSDDNEFDAMFAGSTRIWVGVSYAVVGALVMFGFAFIYEKFLREKFFYNPIDREEEEV